MSAGQAVLAAWAVVDPGVVGPAGWQPFVNLGAIGVLAAMLLVFAKGAYQREVKRADAAEAALAAHLTKVIDIYAPAAERMAIAAAELLAETRESRRGGG